MESQVPSVLNPYRDTALEYRKAGFPGPLPIPYKKKDPVPVDTNKIISKYPTIEKIEEWRGLGQRNICVRLAGVDKDHELMGVDVDDYFKGDKKKEGWTQLLALEEKYGKLPETWISSARTDGKSGIRYFRVPRGLQFAGKVSKDIEVIRKGHRYAMVWPSLHPDGGTYWWFPPGINPDKEGKSEWDGELPNAREFPFLPDPWIDFLTRDRMLAPDDEVIDMDSSVTEIYDWATDTFHGTDESPPCMRLRQKLDLHLKKLETTATFHDLLTNAHWNIVKLSFEGHVGWNEAINEYEAAFCEAVAKSGGGTTYRDLPTLHKEIWRSRIQALRKIKGDSDKRIADGMAAVDACCQVTGGCSANPQGISIQFNVDGSQSQAGGDSSRDGTSEPPGEFDDIPKGPTGPIEDFELNDDGNALHFYKYFTHLTTGPSFRWVEGYGWIIWHDGNKNIDGEEQPGWHVDADGSGQIRRMWQEIKKRQLAHAENLQISFYTNLAAANQTGNVTASGNPIPGSSLAMDKAVMVKMTDWAERSGNVRQVDNMLKALKHLPGVALDVNELNQNPFLLGVANGVLELQDKITLRPASPQDLITHNTNVRYEKPSNHSHKIWQDYLDMFLPDKELQKVTQIALGQCIVGGNPEKIMVVLKGDPNTGKSTMVNAIESALGDYAQSVNQSIFQNHKLNPVLAYAISKRVIVCSEFDETIKISAAQVKRLTGGTDRIQAEIKNSNVIFDGVPQFVPILATNQVPDIGGADKALQNRLYVIPFNVRPDYIDKRAANAIMKCGTAVLWWLAKGFEEYRAVGSIPRLKITEDETDLFMQEMDDISAFLGECVARVDQQGTIGYIKSGDMYERFTRWWITNEFQQRDKPSHIAFTKRVKALGYQIKQARVGSENAKFWLGVAFKKASGPNVVSLPSVASWQTEAKPETDGSGNT